MAKLTDAQVIAISDKWQCETVHYGAWDTGTRTIYDSPVKLWCETVSYGNPMFAQSQTRWTVWPKCLPKKLPEGATSMDDSDPYFGAWVEFDSEIAACRWIIETSLVESV